jgi:hypothetical protein
MRSQIGKLITLAKSTMRIFDVSEPLLCLLSIFTSYVRNPSIQNLRDLVRLPNPYKRKALDHSARELVATHSTAQVHVWRLSILFEISHEKNLFLASEPKHKELQKWE